MHVEDPREVVGSKSALQVQTIEWRQGLPSIVHRKKESESRGAVEKLREGRGEDLTEVRELRPAGYDGSWRDAPD